MNEEQKREHEEMHLIFAKIKPLKEQIGNEAYELIKRKVIGCFMYKEAFNLLTSDFAILTCFVNQWPQTEKKDGRDC